MRKEDWSKFTITANFTASVQDIYKCWSTSEGIEKWFLREAIYQSPDGVKRSKTEPVQVGDHYKWFWHGFPDDVFESRTILQSNGKDFFQFQFSGVCTVSIRISRKEDVTLLELTQENIQWEDDPHKNLFIQCQTGWVFYLANLKSIIEGGIDLRNKRVDLLSNFK